MLELSNLSRSELVDRLVSLETEIAREREMREQLEAKVAKLESAYRSVKEQLELLKRRIYVAKAERIDTTQLEFEFAQLTDRLNAIVRERGEILDPATPPAPPPGGPRRPRGNAKPKGRRAPIEDDREPDQRIRIEDPTLHGVAREVGVETSFRIGYQRPKSVLIAVDRVKYEVTVSPAPSIRRNRDVKFARGWSGGESST